MGATAPDSLTAQEGRRSTLSAEPFEDASGEPRVRGFLHRSAAGADGLVLTHGAGSSATHPMLVALATALEAGGVTVLRCDLPYRQARRTGPPTPGSAATDREGLRRAVEALRRIVGGRLFLGGHSYGGRQASMLAAEARATADALLLLSYPLHPPLRPTELRTEHFPELRTPVFFAHGSVDPFGSVEEMRAAIAAIAAPVELSVIDGAGHDLRRRVRTRGIPETAEKIASEFRSWVASAAARGASK